MLTTFSFGISSNLSQQKSPTAEIIGKYLFSRNNRPEKMYAVGLFYYDKFEKIPNEKVVNMSKSTKPYFRRSIARKHTYLGKVCIFKTFQQT